MPSYSLDLRKKVVEVYKQGGTSVRKVAQRFQISPKTVQSWLTKVKNNEDLAARKTGPKEPGILFQHREQLLAIIDEHPDKTLEEYCDEWVKRTQIIVSVTTMWDFLEKEGLTRKKNISE